MARRERIRVAQPDAGAAERELCPPSKIVARREGWHARSRVDDGEVRFVAVRTRFDGDASTLRATWRSR